MRARLLLLLRWRLGAEPGTRRGSLLPELILRGALSVAEA